MAVATEILGYACFVQRWVGVKVVQKVRASWQKEKSIVNELSCSQQDSQCTYNVTLRRVHETTVAVEKQ